VAPPRGPIAQNQFNPGSVAFDLDAFDELIAAHGVELVHWRAMPNPAGLVDRFDSRRPGEDHVDASNGMVYTKAGCFVGAMLGNTKELRAATGGNLDGSVCQLTPPRFYDHGAGESAKRVRLMPKDRVYLRDESVVVETAQLAEVSATLIDRLKFPATCVEDLMDADGTRYQQGVDFKVLDGNIAWLRPPPQGEGGAGKVYGVRYTYRPFWYVVRMVHDIRVAQHLGSAGNRVTEQAPQSVFLERENIYHNEAQDAEAKTPGSPRQAPAPADGGFGVR
jgi:hypothetical protein